jgi:hypothetical protein
MPRSFPERAGATTSHRRKISELMRSRRSPVATPTMKERRFDQLGAVMASAKISSRRAGSTGVGKKSRVDLREAANAENS